MSFRTRKSFVSLQNTISDILDACDCPIECQVNNSQGPEKYEKHRQDTQNAYTLLYQPRHRDEYSSSSYSLI